jgi:hypothetical protein
MPRLLSRHRARGTHELVHEFGSLAARKITKQKMKNSAPKNVMAFALSLPGDVLSGVLHELLETGRQRWVFPGERLESVDSGSMTTGCRKRLAAGRRNNSRPVLSTT